MAIFFSNLGVSDSDYFVCVPKEVCEYDFFLNDIKKDTEDVELICIKLIDLWNEVKTAYKREKYNPNISNKEYCVIHALYLFNQYREYYLAVESVSSEYTPYRFYGYISWPIHWLSNFPEAKQSIQKELDEIK